MAIKRNLLWLMLLTLSMPARAGIVFTPHLSEYSKLPRGQFTETTLVYTSIDEVYDRNGDKVPLGNGAIPPGETTEASLLLLKYLWIGNPFRDTDIPYLRDHDQFIRIIGTLQHQQASEGLVELGRDFGLEGGNDGFGDLFLLGGIYGDSYRWGPLKANSLFATTVKLPVGDYENDTLLNPGTNYWTVIPQLAFHVNAWGRLFVDASFAYQFNGSNDDPGYGGLVPSEAADLYNAEMNFAWKFSEKWFADLGVSYRSTRGKPNKFENPSLNLVDQPQPPNTACEDTGLLDLGLGDLTGGLVGDCPGGIFFLEPQPGTYEDRGIRATLLTAGFYYVYRTSAVFNLRVAYPINGQGSQFDLPYDVFAGAPTGPGGSFQPVGPPISTATATVNGVQEAAAVSASPFFELRFVYLFWAP